MSLLLNLGGKLWCMYHVLTVYYLLGKHYFTGNFKVRTQKRKTKVNRILQI